MRRVRSGLALGPGEEIMAETVRAFQDKNVTLPNGLTIHYSEWPGPRPSR